MGSTIGAEDSGESPIADGASILSSTTDAECSDEIPIIKDAKMDARAELKLQQPLAELWAPQQLRSPSLLSYAEGAREHTNRVVPRVQVSAQQSRS